MRRLTSRTASGPRCAISVADLVRARAAAWPAGTTRLTRPMPFRLVRVDDPAGQRQLLGHADTDDARQPLGAAGAGRDGQPDLGQPELARSDATRMSQASASSSPPPSALPSIAAMVGIGRSARRLKARLLAREVRPAGGAAVAPRSP